MHVSSAHSPRESVFHFSGKDIRVSADASRGSSPAVTEDMVVAGEWCPGVRGHAAYPEMVRPLWRPRASHALYPYSPEARNLRPNIVTTTTIGPLHSLPASLVPLEYTTNYLSMDFETYTARLLLRGRIGALTDGVGSMACSSQHPLQSVRNPLIIVSVRLFLLFYT